MNVLRIHSRTVKTYTVNIEDGEVRDQPYSRVGRQYQVERVEVVKQDGNVSSVKLMGSALKKDGSVGQLMADERLYGEKDWPEWLSSIIKGLA